MTKIEINSANGTVEMSQGFSFWKKRRIWRLDLFDSVRFEGHAALVEEGYGVSRYSIFLEAPGVSAELFTTDDERYARSLHRELTEFLAVRKARVE